jgi:hypothetical protein
MEYIIGGAIVGLVYAGFRFMKYKKAKDELKAKLGDQIIDQASFAFAGALFNAVMAGLSYAFVFMETTKPLIKGLYLLIGGVFVGTLFDMYRIKYVAFTKTAFYIEGINVRYSNISKLYKKKRSRSYVVETNQHQTFVFPKAIVDKIEHYRNKK